MVLRSLALVCVVVMTLLLLSCKEEMDTVAPASPLLLPHTIETDTMPVEVGTDAVPECNCIALEWVRNTEEDLEEYEIFRSTLDSFGFVSLAVVPGADSTHVDRNLQLVRYYYYMVARDVLGNTSEHSTVVDYKLTSKATPTYPAKWDTLYTDSVTFEWDWDGGLEGAFLTKLHSFDEDSVVWMGWTNAYERPLKASSPAMPRGDYKWRVDYIGDNKNEGSESNWIAFYLR
jgi:hypothetical protein